MVKFATVASASAIIASVAPSVIAAPIVQADDALVEREPLFPLLFGAGSLIANAIKKRKRDLGDVELEQREPEPLFPLLFGAGSLIANAVKRKRGLGDEFELLERGYEDGLEQREPLFPLLFTAGSAIANAVRGRRKRGLEDMELEMREYFDEFEVRDFEDVLDSRYYESLDELD
ncbi:hypothetical protein CC1G_02745 [Coprinopsis cinerea okayama7|uniref:PS II complex 12 kDa extrinsic protein n=1 Tax=Coprinopsis cinerea (strain Okayama-7 / 130 / ATCC MYA-4618 / FGSC 9003) TaxID=240176 RepID=A8MZY0_COPC7|nr:hypothetical protein CC1G_02745 [Coprinopsis cinerea okayama7\|eukprot:XP_001828164.1 hypothetical protein CC1G_02745 [Coprinopsis cinerea okayama7\